MSLLHIPGLVLVSCTTLANLERYALITRAQADID